ncbi:MAG: MBL fold metallo-hydrolase [Bdellovibrionales bacterium]|nr:MBL fold metallo-hydrolase [Ramlibacter sp.]
MTSPDAALRQIDEGLWQVAAGVFTSNCYIHCAPGPATCVLIDPGLDPQGIDAHLAALGRTPAAVLCTHGHFDHVGGASYFQEKYGVPVYLPQADIKTMKASNFLLMALKIPKRITLPEVTPVNPINPVTAGQAEPVEVEVEAGGARYTYLPCAGHTPGSCLIRSGDYVFSGDSLYARGVGLSHLPGEDRALLRANIRALMDTLPAGVMICPGHGPTAPFGDICRENQALLEFLQATD